jgi:hypothetical protein
MLVLVALGAQLLGMFTELLRNDPGFRADRVLASIVISACQRCATPEHWERLYRRILGSVRRLSGVDNAGKMNVLPFSRPLKN